MQDIHKRNQRRTLCQLREYDGGIHGGQVAQQEGMGKQRLLLLPRHGLLLKPSAEASQIPDDRLAGDVIRVFAHEQHGEDLRQLNGMKSYVHRHGDLFIRVILDPAAGLFLQLKPAIDILAGKPAPEQSFQAFGKGRIVDQLLLHMVAVLKPPLIHSLMSNRKYRVSSHLT